MDRLEMTTNEQEFAVKNHGLLLKFLSDSGLGDEYYSELCERYLRTVIRYCNEPEIQKYAFSTILWKNLRGAFGNYQRKISRVQIISSDDERYQPPGVEDAPFEDELLERLRESLTSKQIDAVMLRNQGYSNKEIAEICGVTESAIEARFKGIRQKIKRSKII